MKNRTIKLEPQTEVGTKKDRLKKVCGDNTRKYSQST